MTKPHAIGTPVVMESASPSRRYAVVFEDDGDSGYLYGLDLDRETEPILAGLHVYTVAAVVDRETPVAVQIVWSDGHATGLYGYDLLRKLKTS